MDVTAEDRAHLEGTLTDQLGAEATRTMMAHLPEGGAATLAEELRAEIRQCATKEDLERFATKEDLERFATKEDLERFATKEDLERFATKEDLERFATKDDLLHFATKDDYQLIRTELVDLRTQVTKAMEFVMGIRGEVKDDLVRYVGRQSMIQLAAMVGIVATALTLAYAIVAAATP